MQVVIVHNWPRISCHRPEVLRGLTIAWCRIEDETKTREDLKRVQEMVKETTRLLASVSKDDVDVAAEYRTLIDSEPRLQCLLIV